MHKIFASVVLGTFLTAAAHAQAESVQARGIVNSVGSAVFNITHDPIPEIGWPTMTMDIAVLEGAKIGDVTAGDAVSITLEKGPDGIYGIRTLEPQK